ncbi:MAG: NHL repeat-containing protein, partial [Chloroflexi bacterium]|nr:NHL repeat-containing protein [Chloroflexota bacterium]
PDGGCGARRRAGLLPRAARCPRLVFVDREPYSHIYLFWTPPGRPREIIPSSVLLPPQGEDLPPTGAVGPAPTAATVLPSGVIRFTAGPPLGYRVETSYGLTGAGRLLEPRAAALDASGNLHVLDSGALQVVVFAPDGTFLRRYAGPAASAGGLQEPTGLVIASNGRSYLLDATTASVAEYAPDGQFLGTIPLERRDFYKPRGLSIGSDDHLLVADTGQNRVLRFSLSGKLLAVFGGRKGAGPGEMLEPTDAALLPSGDVLVLDTGNRRLQWFTPDGRYRAEWPINWSVPLNGPHLTLDPQGRPLVTDPERGRFARYDAERAIVQFAGGPDQFRLPVEILRDQSGAIYLVETGGGKVTRLVLSE